LRIVLDSMARLPLDSRLVRTAREVPLLVEWTEGLNTPRQPREWDDDA
jgi:riboflavin biosynthesis pyrimidine reductase